MRKFLLFLLLLSAKSFNGESVSKTFLLEKESGISSIGADNDDTLRVYDLMGRRIEVENLSQLSSGLYIVNGVKTAIRKI